MPTKSPYHKLPPAKWLARTKRLMARHPLDADEIRKVVLKVWDDIFRSTIGSKPFRIGKNIFPKPQIMAFFLHELIPLELSLRYPGLWRGDTSTSEKDLVYIPNLKFSVEIKASSSASGIYGNRSFAQKPSKSKKDKSGYYLIVNFEKFAPSRPKPGIKLIRFGWLDHKDWSGQKQPTGQQAHLHPKVRQLKLLALYPGE